MSETSITEIKNMIESAEASLRTAKKLLFELDPSAIPSSPRASHPGNFQADVPGGRVIEGAFNGESMQATDGEIFPVPANYASKSKLVAGDHMKLTIAPDGRFIYKQIGPIPRKTLIGTLVHEDGQFKVLAEGSSFRVLLASVTYYKGQVGDKVTILVPEGGGTDWATIEALLPGEVTELNVIDDQPEEEVEVDF
ncbi:MAG: hypothetical protein P1V18_05040 [Candidatus Gracilibacteria bacterium]|nr:hypothetical protein [Candidatus Gracilibacteria bacterium]